MTNNKKTKKVFRMYNLIDCKLLEEHYKKMALEGWLITESKRMWDIYKQIEPKDLDFSVSIFQPEWLIDIPDNEKRSTFKEFCEDSGWKLATDNNLFTVFYKESNKDVTPIYTDPKEEYSTIVRSFFKGEGLFLFLLILQFIQLFFSLKILTYKDLIRSSGMFSLTNSIFIISIILILTVPSLKWIIVNKIRLDKDKQLKFASVKISKIKYAITYSILFIYLLYLVISIIHIFSKVSINFVLVVSGPFVFIFIGLFLYRWKIQKIIKSRKFKILSLILTFFVLWIGSLVIVFSLVSRFPNNFNDEVEYNFGNTPIIEFNDFNYEYSFNPERYEQNSSFLVEQSFDYVIKNNSEEINYIRVEYIETRFEWVTKLIKDLIIKEIKNDILENRKYSIEDEYSKDYILMVPGYENKVDELYYISPGQTKLLLVNDNKIYIVILNIPIENEILETVVNKLFP